MSGYSEHEPLFDRLLKFTFKVFCVVTVFIGLSLFCSYTYDFAVTGEWDAPGTATMIETISPGFHENWKGLAWIADKIPMWIIFFMPSVVLLIFRYWDEF